MNKLDDRLLYLEDVIEVLTRFVPDEAARDDIYNELVYTFNVQAEDDNLLGIDPVFDKVFKELIFNDEEDAEVA